MSLGTIPRPRLAHRSARAPRPTRNRVLRAVVEELDVRRDGELPTELPGVAETFEGPLDLVATLQLRWHAHLSGAIEAALTEQPADLEQAVLCAWRTTARDLTGVRLVLDRYAQDPVDDAMARALGKALDKDRAMLAVMAGQAAVGDPQAARVGHVLELLARAAFDPAARPRHRADVEQPRGPRVLGRRLRHRAGRAGHRRDLLAV
jgi:hypothetical protein